MSESKLVPDEECQEDTESSLIGVPNDQNEDSLHIKMNYESNR